MGVIVTEANHGGGLHGRIAIELKQAFFDKVKDSLRDSGRAELADNVKYHELFALSAGTSFGALATVGLSSINGRDPYFSSPAELGEFIDENADKIFPHHSNIFSKIFQNPRQLLGGFAGTPKFNNRPLKNLIQDIVGKDTRMSDVDNDIMLTMTKLHPDMDAVFAKSHVARGEITHLNGADDAERKNWLLWEAALGSASPTTFFHGVPLTTPIGADGKPARDDRIVVVDGGQSGWNDPSIPTSIETVYIYGRETEDIQLFDFVDRERTRKAFTVPHDVVHIHWGTGNFKQGVEYDKAIKNTLASVGGAIVSASMQSVHNFSVVLGQSGVRGDHFFNLDQEISEVPKIIRPDRDFTLSTKDQMIRLRETGLFAADQLSDQIQEAASLVADAYIERFDYEAENPGKSYKDFLKPSVLEV